ncbi:protein FAM117A-like [Synchiropus splendidus]|uniref:protein FAM117A-like n=1 Tax=Synchiropus splendidus TaxID=270530 RepID=UPI00237EC0C6|nr:protein FAM117A-like [Synchiropus splendidus]
MSGHTRGPAPGLQPLKATVPYQLSSKPRPHRRDGKSASKVKAQQLSPGMRRTMSLDAIIGPYLQGHWPKESEGQGSAFRKDKATQTPHSWSDKMQDSGSHKRSASWESTEQLQEIAKLKQQLQQRSKPAVSGAHDKDCERGFPPGSRSLGTTQTPPIPIPVMPLSSLVPPLGCSMEALNQELEGVFISQSTQQQHQLLEVPDGRRAPVPLQSCSSGSQSDPASNTSLSSSSASSSPSASPTNNTVPHPKSGIALLDLPQDGAAMDLLSPNPSQSDSDLSVRLLISSSPGLNKSFCFQREPPEGCEKVKVCEETRTAHKPKLVHISSCPDPKKVNFTPYGGSAFCPVNLPPMDLLLCNFNTSTENCSSHGSSPCRATSTSNPASPPDPRAAASVETKSGTGFTC